MAENKKFSVKKAIAVAGCVTILGLSIFLGQKYISEKLQEEPDLPPVVDTIPDETPAVETPAVELAKLETPVVEYDEENNIVSWNEIENAEKYLLKVNGVEQEVEETQAQVDIEEKSNYTISVKALGDGKEYLDSEEASISGYRQDQNEVYYKNIESNIYKFFDTYKYNGKYLTYVKDILNVEYEDNKLTVLFKCTTREETAPVMEYKEIIFDLNSVYSNDNVTLKTISEASNYIFDLNFNQINYRNLTDNIFSYGTGCYDVMIEDERLTGQLREYLDNGYTATRLYSEISADVQPDKFVVNSCIRLQKDEEIKIVTVQNFIYQKYNGAYALDGYVKAYLNGTAEDVRIEESKFEENSSTSEIWQKADDKYGQAEIQQAKAQYYTGAEMKFYSQPAYSPEL